MGLCRVPGYAVFFAACVPCVSHDDTAADEGGMALLYFHLL